MRVPLLPATSSQPLYKVHKPLYSDTVHKLGCARSPRSHCRNSCSEACPGRWAAGKTASRRHRRTTAALDTHLEDTAAAARLALRSLLAQLAPTCSLLGLLAQFVACEPLCEQAPFAAAAAHAEPQRTPCVCRTDPAPADMQGVQARAQHQSAQPQCSPGAGAPAPPREE